MKKYLRITAIATLVVLSLSSCLTINIAPYKNMQSAMEMKKDESPRNPQQGSKPENSARGQGRERSGASQPES